MTRHHLEGLALKGEKVVEKIVLTSNKRMFLFAFIVLSEPYQIAGSGGVNDQTRPGIIRRYNTMRPERTI